MKLNLRKKLANGLALAAAAFVITIVMGCVTPSFGQAEQPERVESFAELGASLKSEVVVDDLDGSNDEYFYVFNTRPGKLTVTLEVQAAGTNAGAELELLNMKEKSIMSGLMAQGINSGSDRVSKSIQLLKGQSIAIRVKGIRYGSSGGTGEYKITLGGSAIKFR